MLRHIRMTSRVTPFRIPTKLLAVLRDSFHVLYPLTIPHRTPTIGEPDPICRCPYPIFTLCTPQPSPYDLTTSPVVTVAAPAPVAATDDGTGDAAGRQSRGDPETTAAIVSSTTTSAPLDPTGEDAAASAPATGSAKKESDGKGQNRLRPALRVRKLWRGRERPEVYHPNVMPNRPTCYRCDICDGFQDVAEDTEKEKESLGDTAPAMGPPPHTEHAAAADAMSTAAPAALSVESSGAARRPAGNEEEDVDEEVEEADEEEDFAGRPVSTDITNTIMPDAEVAELRYLDPFLVEVLGRPDTPALSRRFGRHFMAQLARCHLAIQDLAKRTRHIARNNAFYSSVYNQWIQQQQQDKKQAARDRRSGSRGSKGADEACRGKGSSHAARQEYLTDKVEMLDRACYAVRFAIAAYGLPYELGYFNSVLDIAKLQAEPHRRYTCATSEEQMESMRRMLLGEEPNGHLEFAASRYSIAIGRPCYSIVLDHEARRVVLAFRGTLTMADAIVDVTEGYAEVNLLADGDAGAIGVSAGKVKTAVPLEKLPRLKQRRYGDKCGPAREGLDRRDGAAATESIRTRVPLSFYEAVREAATSLVPALQTIHSQYGSYELFITGHSLGAMEANLFYLLYCFPSGAAPVPFEKVQTYTFGGAPVVEECIVAALNRALTEERAKTGSRLVNFSYGKDCVPRLHVRSILQTLSERSTSDTAETSPPTTRSASDATANSSSRSRGSDKSAESRKRRPAAPTAFTQDVVDLAVLPQMAVAGAFYNIPHTLRRGCFAVPLDCPWRSQFILSAEAIYHHFPIHYARALNRLLYYYSRRLTDTRLPPQQQQQERQLRKGGAGGPAGGDSRETSLL